MRVKSSQNKEQRNVMNKNLPKVLSYYDHSDYVTQQKARFIFHLGIVTIAGIILLIFSSIYIQLYSIEYNGIFLPVISAMFTLLLILVFSLILLIKGKFGLATHLFMVTTMICVWVIMWVGKGNAVMRLDSVILIIALLNLTPLFITKYKSTIVIYILANVLMLIIFLYKTRDQLSLNDATIVDYFIDTTIAIIFTGILGYNIFRINKQSLEKAEYDFNELKRAESELVDTESKYQALFENAQIGIYRTTPDGRILQANPALIKMLGFDSFEDLSKRNTNDKDAYVNSTRKSFVELIEKQGYVKNFQLEWKKKSNDSIIVKLNARAVRDNNNKTIFYEGFVENITERMLVEKALKESQQEFQALAQISPVGIFRTDAEGHTTYVNPKWMELSGLSFEDALDDDWLKAVHPFDKEGLLNRWKTDSSNGEKSFAEYRFIKPNGQIVWVLGKAVPEIINNEIKGYIGTITDITERKIIEKALTESEEKYRTLMENMNEVVMMVDNEDRIQYVNKKFSDKLGYLPDEVIGEIGYKFLFDQNDLDVIENAGIKRRKNMVDPYELSFAAKNGQKISFLVSASPMINPEGKSLGFILAMADITDRKITEKLLKESEEKYRTLMESMNEVIMMVDNDDKVQYVNKKFTETLGYTEKEIIGEVGYKKLLDPIDHEKIIKANQERTKNVISQYEASFIAKNGNRVDFLISGAPIKNSDGKVIGSIGSMVDMTEKKKIEKELEKYRHHLELLVQERTEELATTNEELTSTNEELHTQREELEVVLSDLQKTQKQLIQAEKMASLGVLASGIAHEINNPLNFIKGGVFGIEQYLNETLIDHKEELLPFLDGINTGIDRAANIVTSLNHYSRKNDLKKEECDIHAIIDNCLVILRNQMVNRIEIKKKYTAKSHKLIANEGKLHQVMLNILSNAIQAIEFKGTVSVMTKLSDINLLISVSDTGCGISAENMTKIMDPFFTTKDPGKGTGLGLSITYNILEELNGSIDFNSSVGKGTKVTIKLPLKN